MFQSAVIHAEYAFGNHNAVVNGVCYNRHQDCFVSSDDTCLRLWSPLKDELRRVDLPPRTNNFIQALEYIESRQVYVAAALDGTLKIYDTTLSELASVFTGRGAILSLVFDAKHNRLLSGGVDGCAAWLVRGKPLGATENGVNPHYELSPLPTFFSAATHVPSSTNASSARHSSNGATDAHAGADAGDLPSSPTKPRKPSTKTSASSASRWSSSANAVPLHRRPWVQKLQLSSDRSKLYAQSKQCVDVFSAADGRYLETYADLFPKEYGAIMAFVVHEKTQYIVCGCLNGWIFVVSLHPVSVVHVFKDHTLRVTGLAVHATSHLILSSSLDGTVRLWDLEARRQAHRLDIGQPVYAIELLVAQANPCRFYCRVRSAIQLYRIQSTIKEHLPALSPICVLQRVLPPARDVGDANGLKAKAASIHASSLVAKARSGDGLYDSPSDDDGDNSYAGSDSDEDADGHDPKKPQQVIVAAGMDKTIRLFAGRTANEAPSFTWIPEEAALDMIGFALHPLGNHLFLLLESQKIVVVDVSVREKEESAIVRIVDMSVNTSAFGSGSGANGSSRSSVGKSSTGIGSSSRDLTLASGNGTTRRTQQQQHSQQSTSSSSSSSSSSSWSGAPRGGIKCICVCYYPPIFRSAATSATATAHVTPAAQSKWFSRTFVNRRQPSSVAQELKRLEEEHAASSSSDQASGGGHHRRNALVQSEYEWIVCGSEFGHLLFWHTGLANTGREAISIDAHDAGIIAVATSTSSPLLVSLDDAHRVHLWHFQPVFMLRHMLDLSDRPSCFVLSPRSEMLLSGYDDGSVVLMDVHDLDAGVQTFAHDDENHFAMVSAGDFLDERALVLTASVDAVVKVWDHEKTLLRQLNLAMAFTSLCFMNARGDVMAGLSNGIFIVTHEDVLPERTPSTNGPRTRRRDGGATQRDTHASVWHRSPGKAAPSVDPGALGHPSHPSPQLGDRLHSSEDTAPSATTTTSGARGDSSSSSPTAKASGRREAASSESSVAQQPQSSTSPKSSWKKPKQEGLTKWLTYEDRPLAVQEPPPVLRPLQHGEAAATKVLPDAVELRVPSMLARASSRRQVQSSATVFAAGASSSSLTMDTATLDVCVQRRKEPLTHVLPLLASDGKEEDWREQLMCVYVECRPIHFEPLLASG